MPHIWTSKNHFHLFLSHISEQREFAGDLRTRLSYAGISAFVAHEDIKPTHEWQDTIESALKSMDALLAVLHEGFQESKWCDQEVGFALGLDKPVIAVRLDLDPYGFIGKYQAVNGRGKGAGELAAMVAEALSHNPLTAKMMARKLVDQLLKADTWETARAVMERIMEVESADEDVIDLLESAPQANLKVKEEWNAKRNITAIAKKWRRLLPQ